MKLVLAVFADFEESFLGGRAALETPLAGAPVIAHTLRRAARVDGAAARCLFVRPRDADRARAAIEQAALPGVFDVLALDDGRRPRRGLVRSARKWNLDGWRGSPFATTWFDEFVEPLAVARVLDHYECEGVLCVEAHQAALDVGLCTALLAHQRDHADDARFAFTHAPPGFGGAILRRGVTRDLLEQDVPLGVLLSYRPEIAQADPITHPVCLAAPASVAHTAARFVADTRASRARLEHLFQHCGADADAATLAAFLRERRTASTGVDETLPREVEIELTTDDPLPDTTLRPRGARVPRRRVTELDALERVARELGAYDDRLIVLAGHGDPLAHPDFADACRRIRAAGVCGLAVVSPLVELPDAAFAALFESAVDVLQVPIDANSPATYRAVHGVDAYERVLANIERIQRERVVRTSPQPLVAPSLVRSSGTIGEMEAFFDRWTQTTGWAVIEGYNEFGGVMPPDGLLPTTPPIRRPCARLRRRVTLLGDGRTPLCGQDTSGLTVLGDWRTESVESLWRGAALGAARDAHARLEWGSLPLCANCKEWSRP
ncbi:MAG: radical SAM protein [Phycisphaerae bacterium]